MHFVYILKSNNTNRYYTGCTKDICARLTQHNAGYNESTKNGVPWVLVCYKKFDSIKQAFLEEKKVKSYKCGNAFKKIINGAVSEWSNVPLC